MLNPGSSYLSPRLDILRAVAAFWGSLQEHDSTL